MQRTNHLIHENPATLLQSLIRFDTTNPPGNEKTCIEYIRTILQDAGIETTILAKHPERPNLLARLRGDGRTKPLLLYGHTDVVTTIGQNWTYPPFEAQIHDGMIWGRGALDMKHGLAMYLAAILRAKHENLALPGDILFAATVDEEVDSKYGAKFLVEEHAQYFTDVQFALSEFGGASLDLAGKRFYPIQTAEKITCPVQITLQGKGGHGAVPIRGGAMAKLSRALQLLERRKLPVHITPQTSQMVKSLANGLGGVQGLILRQLLNPWMTESILRMMGSLGDTFSPLLHNSASPTMIKAGDKHNVIPTEVTLFLDGRLLPGYSAADLKNELLSVLGTDNIIEVNEQPADQVMLNMGLFPVLANTIKDLDPPGLPIPFVNFACTDARFFSRLGIQTYGFTPLQLGGGLSLTNSIHTEDERVPVQAIEFGTRAVYKVLQNFHMVQG